MNQERKEELIVRWMDDDSLSSSEQEELNRILEAEPELKELRDHHQEVREELQVAFGEAKDVPYGDFFQTKLKQAIRTAERDEVPEVGTPASSSWRSSSWRDALRWWLAPVAVGAMAVAFLAGTRVGKPMIQNRTVVKNLQERPAVYTPAGGVTSSIVNADAEGTSVIVLDGLQPIPDSFNLMAGAHDADDFPEDTLLISAKSSSQIY